MQHTIPIRDRTGTTIARALVDADMQAALARWKWYLKRPEGYARHDEYDRRLHRYRPVLMHHCVLPRKPGLQTDHVNGDKLDNRRANLRYATRSQNQANRSVQRNSRSGLKGIWWHEQHRKWRAQIYVRGKRIPLGYFSTPNDAARAYDQAALVHFKDCARLNFPTSQAA